LAVKPPKSFVGSLPPFTVVEKREWTGPRKKNGKSQRFSVRISSLESLLVNRGEFTLISPEGLVKPFL
jgi:hypothetical protein